MTSSIPEVEWHQSEQEAPPALLKNTGSSLAHITVLIGMARDPDTKERIGPLYMAPLGTPPSTSYPPDLAWLSIKDSEEATS